MRVMARASPRTDSVTSEDELRVVQLWRESHRAESTIRDYLNQVKAFHRYCRTFGLSEFEHLTRDGVEEFARQYSGPSPARVRALSRPALRAWSYGLQLLGRALPEWQPPAKIPAPLPTPLAEYVIYRRRHRGLAEPTLARDVWTAKHFLASLGPRRKSLARIRVGEVDAFVTDLARRFSPRTLAHICSLLRAFLRFLYATGRLNHDLAPLVMAPRLRRVDRPPRALPWNDVRRILRSMQRDGPVARRDYAMLLLMATYGLGAAEVSALRIEDIDWRAAVLRVRRPKTGSLIVLPMLPGIARAIAAYFRRGRPRHLTTRVAFVSAYLPHRAVSPSAIRHVVRHHAREAGVRAHVLGGHVLRHSHATRQFELGAHPKIVGDILGHRLSSSTSIYVRVAQKRLRSVGLPVPR